MLEKSIQYQRNQTHTYTIKHAIIYIKKELPRELPTFSWILHHNANSKIIIKSHDTRTFITVMVVYKAKRFIEQLINLTVFTIFRRRRHAHAPTLYLRLPSRT